MEKHTTGKQYDEDEVNELLDTSRTLVDNECWLSDKNEIIITQEHSNNHNEGVEDELGEEYYSDLLEPLIGYKVKLKVKGDHKHDGQMVEYKFTFTNPEGEKTKIVTDMCLMQGWNYYGHITIK